MSLSIQGVQKSYGEKVAVRNVSFDVEPGTICGLLGLNGAGKSTTLRIILDILQADEGVVTWNGSATASQVVGHFGYLPEERGLYPHMKVLDHLVLFGRLHGLTKSDATASAKAWLDRFEIPHYAQNVVSELSKGNQQKVQFIAAVLHNPEVMVLDEPFSGLDPVNTSMFKSVMRELADAGHTLLFSSHQLEHVEELSHSVAMIHESHLVLRGEVRSLIAAEQPKTIRIDAPREALEQIVGGSVKEEARSGCYLIPTAAVDAETLLRSLVTNGHEVRHFELVRPTLNDIFLQKVGRAG